MPVLSWRQWLRRLSGTARRAPFSHLRPRQRRLEVEHLETRLAPATHIWNGAGLDGKWANPANWQSNFVPTGGLDADLKYADLVFGAAAPAALRATHENLIPPVGGPTPGQLVFNSITISASGYTLDSPTTKPNIADISLGTSSASGSTGFVTVGVGSLGNNIALNMQLANATSTDQFFTVNSGASLTVSGQLSTATSVQLGAQLTKEGFGILVLTADNSAFKGPIKLDTNAGIVQITDSHALGDTAHSTTVGTNAQLQ